MAVQVRPIAPFLTIAGIPSDAHTLVRSIYAQTVDILPDIDKNELHVRVHNAANQTSDKTVEAICKELTATETIFPGTDLKLVYSLVSQKNILTQRPI